MFHCRKKKLNKILLEKSFTWKTKQKKKNEKIKIKIK